MRQRLYSALGMKRLFSISMMVVLLYSMYLPAWARDMEPMQAASCHRMPMQNAAAKHAGKHKGMHHCDGMEMAAAAASDPGFYRGQPFSFMPHELLCAGNYHIGSRSYGKSSSSPAGQSGAEFHFGSIVFASAGFSSHTDRGPPARIVSALRAGAAESLNAFSRNRSLRAPFGFLLPKSDFVS